MNDAIGETAALLVSLSRSFLEMRFLYDVLQQLASRNDIERESCKIGTGPLRSRLPTRHAFLYAHSFSLEIREPLSKGP